MCVRLCRHNEIRSCQHPPRVDPPPPPVKHGCFSYQGWLWCLVPTSHELLQWGNDQSQKLLKHAQLPSDQGQVVRQIFHADYNQAGTLWGGYLLPAGLVLMGIPNNLMSSFLQVKVIWWSELVDLICFHSHLEGFSIKLSAAFSPDQMLARLDLSLGIAWILHFCIWTESSSWSPAILSVAMFIYLSDHLNIGLTL